MEMQLRDKTMNLSATTTDLLYIQVLDNLARTIDNPSEMPFFNVPASGTAQLQQQVSATVTPGWGLFASTGALLFNSLTGAFSPSQIDQESWQVAPTGDPDRLALMHCAFLKATGHGGPGSETPLLEYYSARDGWVNIGIQQVEFSNSVWDMSREVRRRQNQALSTIPDMTCIQQYDWDLLRVTDKKYWKDHINPLTVSIDNFHKHAIHYLSYDQYFRLMLGIRLSTDPDYQRLLSKYAILVPPPSQTAMNLIVKSSSDAALSRETPAASGNFPDVPPNLLAEPEATAPSPYGSGAAGGGAGGGGGGSGSGGGGGAGAGAGGKAPLPIHIPYYTFLRPGWYCVGCKNNVPKDACFVGHHCNTYVWVTRYQMDGLNKFTLAILDFYNIGNTGGSNIPTPPPATLGR